MRYLGSKESLTDQITSLLNEKKLLKRDLIFFDAFCGMGAVVDTVKRSYNNIILNDSLKCSVTYSQGRLYADECTFATLGFDPFEYFNSNHTTIEGFIYKNYSPGDSNRMYFTQNNAGRIDYFRQQIESWYLNNRISYKEYVYLIACLLESVSDVSNTAGVYGAFLKHWDSRALKPIFFSKINSQTGTCPNVIAYNKKIEDIISNIECDILYLDPPYLSLIHI